MHFLSLWLALISLAAYVVADVEITSPTSGQTYTASGGTVSFTVKWSDSADSDDDDDSLTKVEQYAIVLLTGSNDDIMTVKSLTTSLSSDATSYAVSLDSSDYPDGTYFIQVYAQFSSSAYTIHYTPRFKLSNMDGKATTWSFSASLFSVTGTNPAAQTDLTTAATINSASFSVTYTSQTGRTRYAPMQTQPGSTVTYSMYSTRHATSPYTPYSTIRASPDVYSTITPGWDYTVTSAINTAAVADYPTYYYPASERVRSAELSTANSKRWL